MSPGRKLTLVAVIGVAPLLLTALAAGPATAHGAMANPVSRASACGAEGGERKQSAACQAAAAVSRGQATDTWDAVRVANVRGRDRQVIPDGQLCSGGKPEFAGLDLPRADWPATTLAAGADFTFSYRATIPHKGAFRLYVTKDGYVPTRPLTWSDLEAEPFLTVTDPPLANGSYVIAGQLPPGKTGRQLIYTIWQNVGADTYYSCSDVVFTGAGPGGAAATGRAEAPAGRPTAEATVVAEPASVDQADESGQRTVLPLAFGGAAALAVAGGVALAVVRRRQP
jgi:predicted carbohydrate-binding protein with CBM5 and CBM33 domain